MSGFEMKIQIGTWTEKARTITRCPSYYAADYEKLTTVAGEVPAFAIFVGGYLTPMAQWLVAKVPAVRLEGRLYSGFGGVNFASTELEAGEAIEYGVQTYAGARYVRELIEEGLLTLDPAFAWMALANGWDAPGAPQTWEALRGLSTQAAI